MRTRTGGGRFRLASKSAVVAVLGVASCTAACWDATGGPADGAADAGADAQLEPTYTAELPEPPAPVRAEPTPPDDAAEPELPSWDCPDGWLAVPHAGVLAADGAPFSHCEPVRPPRLRMGDEVTPLDEGEQEGDRPICDPATDGTFPVLGSADCQPLGDPCPAGTWPDIPAEVTGTRIHVLPGAVGGDGREVAPYGTIVEAVEAATDGDVVVLGTGTHYVDPDRRVRVDRRLTVWGACVQRTEVVALGPFGDHAALTAWRGGQLTVRNVRIAGEQYGIMVTDEGSSATLEGVWVADTTDIGIYVGQGAALLDEVLVTDTRSASTGYGLFATLGANVEVLRSTFERSRWAAILAYSTIDVLNPPTVVLEDLLVRDTVGPDAGERDGRGLSVEGDASVTVRRALVERSTLRGVSVGDGGSLDLQDVVVTESGAGSAEEATTNGLRVRAGGQLVARRFALLDSTVRGITISDEGTTVVAEDLVVAGTHGLAPDVRGLVTREGAQCRVERGLIERNHGLSIQSDGEGTRLELSDVSVVQSLPLESDLRLGGGVAVLAGSLLQFERLHVADSHAFGVGVDGGRLEGEDLIVTDTSPQASDGQAGSGLQATLGAQVVVTRGRFDANHLLSVGVFDEGTTAIVEDLEVVETLPGFANEAVGFSTSQGAALTVRRSDVAWTASAGAAASFGSSLTLEDARFHRPRVGAPTSVGGIGLLIFEGAVASAVRVAIEGAGASGVQVDGAGTVAGLEDLRVTGAWGHTLDGSAGSGAAATMGATLEIRRAELRDNRSCAVAGEGAGSRITLEDVILAETTPRESDGDLGIGLCLVSGSSAELRRARIEDNALSGIALSDPGTSLTAEDVAIVRTTGTDTGSFDACGLLVKAGAELASTRTLVESVVGIGVGVIAGAHAVLGDLTVRDVLAYPVRGVWGRGLHAESGARVEVERARIDGCHDLGVGAFGEDTFVSLDGTSVAGTRPQVCAAEGGAAGCDGRGYGLGSYHGAEVQLEHVEALGSTAVGIQIARGGRIRGSDVAVRRSPVCLNLQDVDVGFDFGNVVSGLVVEQCGVMADPSALPVPEAWGMER